MPDNDNIEINIYNIEGRKVKELYSGYMESGFHSLVWDGSNGFGNVLPSGIYIGSLKYQNKIISNKMVKVK